MNSQVLNDKHHIGSLTGIRAIAAYLVFFHHFTPSSDDVGVRLFLILWEGHVGVSIFFVLSGFLIAYNYAANVSLKRDWIFQYARNRFARIYPVFFITTVITMIYIQDWRLEAWFLNLTFLRGFFGDYYFYHIGQAWSLTVELCFYILAPGILLLIGRIPLGIQCLVIYFVGYSLSALGNLFPEWRFLDPPRMLVVNTFFGRCFEFYLGAWLFLFFRSKPNGSTKPWHSWGLFTSLGIALSIVAFYAFAECRGLAVYSPTCSPLHHYFFPVAAATVIYGLWKEKTFVSRLLASPVAVLLGKSSYVFYLIHAFPFQEMIGVSQWTIPARFVAMNAVAILGYLLIERPLHLLLRAPKR